MCKHVRPTWPGWGLVLALMLSGAGRTAPLPGDVQVADYFRAETARLEAGCLAGIRTLEDWTAQRELRRQQLFEMLGLWPVPERTPLHPVVTGRLEREVFTVENVHFQSMPGLYVTANLYLPRGLTQPAPTILYVCGHGAVKTNDISYGNKVSYHHHGAWFAAHGYVCLTVDTLQLGEIEGQHHGTYRLGQWVWNSRGYTPAGVEAWNNLRALDYLESRPEVDRRRIGMTGRSGGGAYSWTAAALDERVRVVVPVAGMTDLRNYVVDGAIAGHCDCMFHLNAYGWDLPEVAALIAPRPLLLANSDKDTIFPLDGVLRVHDRLRALYGLYNARTNLGLLITEGPHKDTQDLQVPAFRWFNRFLKNEDTPIEAAALRCFQAQELKVFAALPADQRNTRIEESFVARAPIPAVPASPAAWQPLADTWRSHLRDQVFRAWPDVADAAPVLRLGARRRAGGLELQSATFVSQEAVELPLLLLRATKARRPERVVVRVLDEPGWPAWADTLRAALPDALAAAFDEWSLRTAPAVAAADDARRQLAADLHADRALRVFVVPRGVGPTAWTPQEPQRTHLRRRFMLLGQTLDSMRVWDIRQALAALRASSLARGRPVEVHARGDMAVNVLYAAAFDPAPGDLRLSEVPASHEAGPDYLGVLRFLDIPQAAALAAEHHRVTLSSRDPEAWEFPRETVARLGWPADHWTVEPVGDGAAGPARP